MQSLSKGNRAARLRKHVSQNELIDQRTYNLILGGTVLYGLVVNLIICQVFSNALQMVNSLAFLIGYFVLVFAGTAIATKSDNPVISFLGYNMIVVPIGFVVSECVYAYGGIGNTVVVNAFLLTAVITAIMILLSIMYPDFFAGLGRVLFGSLIALIIVSLIVAFTGRGVTLISFISAGIFSLYIGYDFYRSQQFAHTADNAVDSAIDIYLDIINLFLDILRILGSKNRK